MNEYDPDQPIFEAKLEDVAPMSKILHELNHSDDHSVLVITSDGVRLIAAGEKTFQVSAFFACSTFQQFQFSPAHLQFVNFRFILKDFIECLNLLRDDPLDDDKRIDNDAAKANDAIKTALHITYKKRGEPLRLRLENNSNYVINCDLKAFNLPGDSMFTPLGFSAEEDSAVIVFDSRKLYEYVSGLDLITSEFVYLKMCNGRIPVVFLTKSSLLGEAELEIPASETDIIRRELRVSDNCIHACKYRTQFMKPALEALRTSTFMKMKMGESGLLCIEHFHGIKDSCKPEGPFLRPENNGNGYVVSQGTLEYMTDYNQPQKKRSSVEYFILCEAEPSDAD